MPAFTLPVPYLRSGRGTWIPTTPAHVGGGGGTGAGGGWRPRRAASAAPHFLLSSHLPSPLYVPFLPQTTISTCSSTSNASRERCWAGSLWMQQSSALWLWGGAARCVTARRRLQPSAACCPACHPPRRATLHPPAPRVCPSQARPGAAAWAAVGGGAGAGAGGSGRRDRHAGNGILALPQRPLLPRNLQVRRERGAVWWGRGMGRQGRRWCMLPLQAADPRRAPPPHLAPTSSSLPPPAPPAWLPSPQRFWLPRFHQQGRQVRAALWAHHALAVVPGAAAPACWVAGAGGE